LRDAIDAPGFRLFFEGTEHDLAGILLVVRTFIRHAQDRQAGGNFIAGLADDVKVLARLQQQSNPRPSSPPSPPPPPPAPSTRRPLMPAQLMTPSAAIGP